MNELNKKRTDYNLDVWILRTEAFNALEEVTKEIKGELARAEEEKELARVIYPEYPQNGTENLWEARLSASNGVLIVEKKPKDEEIVREITVVPSGRINVLIRELHPKVIIDFVKQVGKK